MHFTWSARAGLGNAQATRQSTRILKLFLH